MYITVTDVVDEKRIDLVYPIWGKEVAVISMFSDNIQYQIRESLNILLIMNEEKLLPKRKFMGRELSMFVGRKVARPHWIPTEIMLKWTSWHTLQRLFSVWTNLTKLTTWKTKTSATCYLGIMRLLMKSL